MFTRVFQFSIGQELVQPIYRVSLTLDAADGSSVVASPAAEAAGISEVIAASEAGVSSCCAALGLATCFFSAAALLRLTIVLDNIVLNKKSAMRLAAKMISRRFIARSSMAASLAEQAQGSHGHGVAAWNDQMIGLSPGKYRSPQ